MESNKSARIVIIGGGFAGVYAYLSLHRRLHGTNTTQITLVSDKDRFEFIPLIHEVATGTLLPSGVSQPIRTIPQCCLEEFIEGQAVAVDFDKQLVHLDEAGKKMVPYDYLVLALGSTTEYFGVPGAEEHTFPIKTLDDAIVVKNQILLNFERASEITDLEEQKRLLRFVVIGGGPTGVEMASEIADFISDELAGAFPTLHWLSSVVLIERGDRVLKKGVHEWFTKKAEEVLERKFNVYVMCDTDVVEVKENGVQTSTVFVPGGFMIWSAGVRAAQIPIVAARGVEKDQKTGRIMVNDNLQVSGYPNVYVAGDMAWICNKEDKQAYPMRAQFAVREGKTAGENIARSIEGKTLLPFEFREKAFIVSLGKGGALAEVFGARFRGPLGWAIYRAAYIASTVGLRSKLRITLEWLLNLFLPRDISKL